MHSLVLVFTHQVNFQKDHISWLLGQLRLKHILWSQFLPHRIPPSWIVSKVELNFQQSHTFSNQTEIYSGSTQIYQSSQKFSKIIGSKSFSHHSQWNLKWTCIMESQWLIVIKRGTLHYTLELFVWISIGCYFMPHWILHLFFFWPSVLSVDKSHCLMLVMVAHLTPVPQPYTVHSVQIKQWFTMDPSGTVLYKKTGYIKCTLTRFKYNFS